MKNTLFIFLFAVMLLPVFQQFFPFVKSAKLYGYFVEAPYLQFSWPKWWDGSYREETNKYVNDHIGFRPELLRVNNQLEYTLFDKLHATWLAPGKNHYLFQTLHIDACCGKDFVGYAAVLEKLLKFRAVKDTLARLGCTLIFIQSPNKACFYPEYISTQYKCTKGPTNYQTYLRIGDSLGIDQIDFNAWFVSMKNCDRNLLYTKQGIHWSEYGALLAADSLMKYIEKKKSIRVPRPSWTEIKHSAEARGADDDLAKTLNLIYPYEKEVFSYPVVAFHEDSTMKKPVVIYIGDSFLEAWRKDGVLDHSNASWQIWNHFNTVQDKDSEPGKERQISGYDWISAIKNADCIVLMYTSFNLPELGDGFIEKAYSYFYPSK